MNILEYGDSPDTAAFNVLNPVQRDSVETHGLYAIVAHDKGRDRFYTVEYTGPQTIHTGHVFRTFHYLRNARTLAKRLATDGAA